MTKKTISLIGIAVLLAGAYIYYFTDWVNPPTIQMIYQVRPIPLARNQTSGPTQLVSFTMEKAYVLTSVKVIPASAAGNDENVQPVWHLVKGTNSIPTRGFFYGRPIQGMKVVPAGKRAESLEPGIEYRVIVEAGRAKGQLTFMVGNPPAQ